MRSYFASDTRRALQTALGLLWLLDGALQFQSFMYSKGFVQLLLSSAAAQPTWLSATIRSAAHLAGAHLTLFNTAFATTQVLIGIGLLYRPAVKATLLASLIWVPVVWCFGEGLGMVLTGAASPLTGAPGAVLFYGIVGALAWPGEHAGGLLGVRGARLTWAVVWFAMTWLWLDGNRADDATRDAIASAPSGVSWLGSVQHAVAQAAAGHGVEIAIVLATLSMAIGLGIAIGWRSRTFLTLAIILSLSYWVLGQGFGGILTGSATDPNTGPLLVLLAIALHPLVDNGSSDRSRSRRKMAHRRDPRHLRPASGG